MEGLRGILAAWPGNAQGDIGCSEGPSCCLPHPSPSCLSSSEVSPAVLWKLELPVRCGLVWGRDPEAISIVQIRGNEGPQYGGGGKGRAGGGTAIPSPRSVGPGTCC